MFGYELTTYAHVMETADSMGAATRETVELALNGYLRCALWTSVDYGADEYLDTLGYSVSDFDRETFDTAAVDVWNLLLTCWGDVWDGFTVDLSGIEPEQLGHDFWLTRNRHGAGFWDRGLGEVGDKLTRLSHGFGGVEPYIDPATNKIRAE